MHVDINEPLLMRLDGTMDAMMTKVSPSIYRKYISMSNGKLVLYVKLQKALYGTLQAVLLLWTKHAGDFTEWGFTINPYNTCVMNRTLKEVNVPCCDTSTISRYLTRVRK